MKININKKFYKNVDNIIIIWYNIIVRGVLYNKKEHMFWQNLVECSTNKHEIILDDNQKKTLINQAKFPSLSYPTQKITLSKTIS